jgi:hypothetical protein
MEFVDKVLRVVRPGGSVAILVEEGKKTAGGEILAAAGWGRLLRTIPAWVARLATELRKRRPDVRTEFFFVPWEDANAYYRSGRSDWACHHAWVVATGQFLSPMVITGDDIPHTFLVHLVDVDQSERYQLCGYGGVVPMNRLAPLLGTASPDIYAETLPEGMPRYEPREGSCKYGRCVFCGYGKLRPTSNMECEGIRRHPSPLVYYGAAMFVPAELDFLPRLREGQGWAVQTSPRYYPGLLRSLRGTPKPVQIVELGIECFSDNGLRWLRKPHRESDIWAAAEWSNPDVRPVPYLLLGLPAMPGANPEQLVEGMHRLKAAWPHMPGYMSSWLSVYEGTPLAELMPAKSLEDQDETSPNKSWLSQTEREEWLLAEKQVSELFKQPAGQD